MENLSASRSVTLRLKFPNKIGMLGKITSAVGEAGGDIDAIDIVNTEEGMIRLTPTSRTAVVPHGARHYGNVPVPMPSEAEVQDLQAALVIDETHGPLTLDSADAVSAAEMHDYVSVSGLIQSVHLESAVTRFVGLPDIAYPLASLGKTPEMDPSLDPLSQTCWRVDLKPLWAHHRFEAVKSSARAETGRVTTCPRPGYL